MTYPINPKNLPKSRFRQPHSRIARTLYRCPFKITTLSQTNQYKTLKTIPLISKNTQPELAVKDPGLAVKRPEFTVKDPEPAVKSTGLMVKGIGLFGKHPGFTVNHPEYIVKDI